MKVPRCLELAKSLNLPIFSARFLLGFAVSVTPRNLCQFSEHPIFFAAV
jgi:hypothetical protein